MIELEEIRLSDLSDFWDSHIKYLIEDEIIYDEEDISYFLGNEYRGILEKHMIRDKDKQHMIYFCRNGKQAVVVFFGYF